MQTETLTEPPMHFVVPISQLVLASHNKPSLFGLKLNTDSKVQ